MDSYLEIGNGNFKTALRIFEQWQALKMRMRYGIVPLLQCIYLSSLSSGDMGRCDVFICRQDVVFSGGENVGGGRGGRRNRVLPENIQYTV